MAEAIKTEELLPSSNGVLLEMNETKSNIHSSQSSNGQNVPKPALTLSPTRTMTAKEKDRRRPPSQRMVWKLSKTSWLFLCLALIQVGVISGLQIAIAALGNFRSSKGLSQYNTCLNPDLQKVINCTLEANQTISIPSFGKDKEIYIYLFLFLTIYNFCLCVYALKTQNYVELIAFVIINLLTMGYAAIQVWQFRGFGGDCPLITNIGYLALTNVMVLLVFTVVFITLSIVLFFEFGWKIYKDVECNSELIHLYRIYKVFLSAVKILILFTVVFSLAQVVLLLNPTTDFEFGLTIVLVVAAILVYGVIYVIVRREWLAGYILLFFIGAVLAPAYYIFKVQRFATRQCPTCIRRDLELKNEQEIIINLLNNQSDISNSPECMNIPDLNISMFPEDRSLQLENLVIFASVNLMTSVVVVLVFIVLWTHQGKGLKDHFQRQTNNQKLKKLSNWFKSIFKCCEYNIEEKTNEGGVKVLQLRLQRGERRSTVRHSNSLRFAVV